MRILVTGATGFIGQQLGIALVREKHEVIALVRKLGADLPFPAQQVLWDDKKPLKDIDAVIHLAGESIAGKRWSAAYKQKILESRTKTTAALRDKLQALQGRKPKVLLAASAIGFYGDPGEKLVDESSAPGKGFLTETCVAWESALMALEGIVERIAVFRLGIVLGRHGGALEQMLPLFKKGVAGPIGNGQQWMSWVHLQDVVQSFVFALSEPKARGIFNLVAPKPERNKDFTKTLAGVLRVPAFLPAPKIALQIALGEMSALVLYSQKVSAKKWQEMGYRFRFAQLEEALKDILQYAEVRYTPQHHEFLAQQWIRASSEKVFSFFSDAKNLETITPPLLHFRVLSQSTEKIQEGTIFEYTIRIHGIPVRWVTLIKDWREGECFSDNQERGPYHRWYHTHEFEKLGEGILMTDRVIYALPLGYIGDLLGHWFVAADVKKIFSYRKQKISEIFGK